MSRARAETETEKVSTVKKPARRMLSVLPKLGLVKKPHFHKDGISFIVPVKDEEEWIKSCLLSIEDVADEIIVVDSSIEDNTTKIIESLAESVDKIKHIRLYHEGPEAFALSCHIGLVTARFKWIFKWDADFVASEKIGIWRKRLESLDEDRYYVIELPRVNLEGDVHHQPRTDPSYGEAARFAGSEARLFTWSPELRWVLLVRSRDNNYERVCGDSIWGNRFPPWYTILSWREPHIFHCNIKNPLRMLTRLFWSDYQRAGAGFASLEDYTEYRVKNEWHMTMTEAQQKVMHSLEEKLVPYDESRFGRLPSILLSAKEKDTTTNAKP
jgi:glycosyltransferase involved in cell wall biosynthesis